MPLPFAASGLGSRIGAPLQPWLERCRRLSSDIEHIKMNRELSNKLT